MIYFYSCHSCKKLSVNMKNEFYNALNIHITKVKDPAISTDAVKNNFWNHEWL